MAKQKLTNSDRESIVKNITKPIDVRIQSLLDEYGKFVDEYLLKLIPSEVREFSEKYPNLVRKQQHVYYSELFCENDRAWIPLKILVNNYFPDYFDREKKLYKKLNEFPQTNELKKKVEALLKKKKEIQGKTRCILEDINTIKQLKDNFPEAYDILIQNNSSTDSDKCDKVESLRAELSKTLK